MESTNCIFLVQDADCPAYVLAKDYNEALAKWQQWVVAESEGTETLDNPPTPAGVQQIANPQHDTILT